MAKKSAKENPTHDIDIMEVAARYVTLTIVRADSEQKSMGAQVVHSVSVSDDHPRGARIITHLTNVLR